MIPNQNKVKDLTGQIFGELKAINYEPGSHGYWICQCSCGNKARIHRKYLINGSKKDCGHSKDDKTISIGDKFGEWTVISNPIHLNKNGKINLYYNCKCSCGNESQVAGYALRRGTSTKCKQHSHIDLTGKTFGDLTVISYVKDNIWKCKCSCGNLIDVQGKYLRNKDIVRCDKCRIHNGLIDLTDKIFGELKVLYYNNDKTWTCQCSCGSIVSVRSANLINGTSRSCGHLSILSASKRSTKYRTSEQIQALYNKESLNKFIYGVKTIDELEERLGIHRYNALKIIKKYNLSIKIDRSSSIKEKSVREFIDSIYKGNIVYNDRNIISPKELGIYIPEKKLAIEFNGNYWHSDIYKDKYYHQQKTIDCAKQGIQLIHIFEYEWDNEYKQNIIKEIIKNKLIDTTKLYARQCKIVDVDKDIANKFNSMYHLQGECNTELNIGLAYNDDIVALISIGKPRFNHEYEYEILRLTFKSGIHIIGGTEKIFKYIISKYEPESIITYCDISKFKGNVYTRLGFKPINDKSITEPNYVWYNVENGNTLSRYQTQKKKLVKQGLGTDDDTESSIMNRFGYIKIYDSGNLRLEYIKN